MTVVQSGRVVLPVLLLVALCNRGIVSAQDATPPRHHEAMDGAATFKSGVDLVALSVTVTDGQHHFVRGLQPQDFVVMEDGVRQEIQFFAAADVPVDLAILLDMSSSMSESLFLVQQAAIGFARTLRPGDRAAVIGFNSGVRFLENLTADFTAVETAIQKTRASGPTSLFNALYIALKEFIKEKNGGEIRRQAIAVLSDGHDTSSLLAYEDVLELAKRAGVSIFTIGLQPTYPPAFGQKRFFSEAQFTLRSLADTTGGRAFFPKGIEDLAAVYGSIADEIAHQYTIGYTPKPVMGDEADYRRVIVRVVGVPEARARTRQGYQVDRDSRISLRRPR